MNKLIFLFASCIISFSAYADYQLVCRDYSDSKAIEALSIKDEGEDTEHLGAEANFSVGNGLFNIKATAYVPLESNKMTEFSSLAIVATNIEKGYSIIAGEPRVSLWSNNVFEQSLVFTPDSGEGSFWVRCKIILL